ncbi:MAG: SUMF1/EgtB/PvdO family nonheme iron enzyme [Verrucomicrobiales bacterium]|nr:SUMF1/EgtB/PvdO family nonheme iron enzyme [Verrucomicrobiales bacterium]
MHPYHKIFAVTGSFTTLLATAIAQDAKLPEVVPVDFVADVKPLLEGACIQCHNPEKMESEGGDYDMTTKAAAFGGGPAYGGDVIRPKEANDSPVYWMTTVHLDDPKDPEAMPPKKPLNEQQQQVLFSWIQSGAEWPEGVTLDTKPRVNYQNVRPLLAKFDALTRNDLTTLSYWVEQGADWSAVAGGEGPKDDLALTEKVRTKILAESKEKAEADMTDYTNVIPKTQVKYDMVAIKGGEFMMGSPESESARNADEGPQHKVKISPFWMGKFEVTWDQYEPFMITDVARNKDGSPQKIEQNAEPVDVISSPTTPYQEMSFGMGTQGFPAICMTEHAALKFCQWLSAQTGHYYRLPTEAEWEYACRAGTTTAYHFGDDPSKIEEYAVLDPNQTRTGYEKVGTKKPNPWGLYDMHGNVLEWCLDQYKADAYADRTGVSDNPYVRPTTLYPRVARGGSWYDTADLLRSAARTASHPDWKVQDPQLPKSIWYHTDATWLGFRLVRPLDIPDAETMNDIWNQGTRDEQKEEAPKPKTPKAIELEGKVKPLIERGGPFTKEERALLAEWVKESL